MFMFPEPPALDHYLANVSPSYTSDGIFYHGKAAACHKCIAKQLKPIKRTLNDPIAPPQELDSHTLNRILDKEKEGFIDSPTKDYGLVYTTLGLMPKWKRDHRSGFVTFPRSEQYELSYVQEKIKDSAKCKRLAVKCINRKIGKEELVKTEEEPCRLLKPPIWWKGGTGKPRRFPVGNINDYAFERLGDLDHGDVKISEKLQMDHPQKYIPGVIHRITNPEDTDMKDVLERADAFKIVLKKAETVPKDAPPVDKCVHPPPESRLVTVKDVKLNQDLQKIDAICVDKDRRWQPVDESIKFAGTDAERQKQVRSLTKPFSHELHTWYSKNKPTKLKMPVKYTGKKPIPERRFSHL